MSWLAVALGGALGSLARYGAGVLIPFSGQRFPWATFSVNVLGSFLIGIAWVVIVERGLWSPEARHWIMTGFLGGFTTFSAFSLETLILWQNGHLQLGLVYVTTSLLAGLAAVAVAVMLTRLYW